MTAKNERGDAHVNAHRLIPAVLATLCALAGSFALATPDALAVMRHEYLSRIVETPPVPTNVHEWTSSTLCGLAVDPATNDLYVTEPGDGGNDAVDVYNSAGVKQSEISGLGAGGFGVTACSVAVSDATHDVYVGEYGQLDVFNGLGVFETALGTDSHSYVAVDNSAGPNRGDIYLVSSEFEDSVEKLNEKNELLSKIEIPLSSGDVEKPRPTAVAVGPNGDLYVATEGGVPFHVVHEFNSAGAQIGEITETPGGPLGGVIALAVDPAGDLYVTENEPESNVDVVDEFNSSGGFVERLSAPGASSFRDLRGVAVSAAGDIYVAERPKESETGSTAVVDEFGPSVFVPFVSTGEVSGVKNTAAALEGAVNPEGVQVTSCEFEYVADSVYRAAVAERALNPYEKGSKQSCSSSPGSGTSEVGVSADVVGLSPSTLYDYRVVASNATGSEGGLNEGANETFSTSGPPTVGSESAVGVTQTGATIQASVYSGESETSVYVEYGESEAYGSRSETVEIPPRGRSETVSVLLKGLSAGALYHYRVVAGNEDTPVAPVVGSDRTFSTLPALRIDGESFSDVGSTSATLNAELDDFGTASAYYYEYGTSTAYGSATPPVSIEGIDGDVTESVELSGLRPDTVYHVRLVAQNPLVKSASGSLAGADLAFTTFPSGEGELPDGRAYELVSAAPGSGAGAEGDVYVPNSQLIKGLDEEGYTNPHGIASKRLSQAAADGEAVAYIGDPPLAGGNGSAGPSVGNEFVARRLPGGGWTQGGVNAPGFSNTYVAFSSDLSVGIVSEGEERLAEDALPAGYGELYVHSPAGGPFEPVLTVSAGSALPEGLGYTNARGLFEAGGLGFGGGNAGTATAPAFSRLLFESKAVLDSTPESSGSGSNNLYESAGGRLYLVNVLPDGQVEPDATFGVDENAEEAGNPGRDATNAISADGSRVYWSAAEWAPVPNEFAERVKALYVRENATLPPGETEGEHCAEPGTACTIQVDAAESGAAGQSGGGEFVAASSDGSRVFFTDEKQLTADSTAGPGEPDLYEYDLQAPEGERLTDLSVPATPGPGAHGDVRGVIGIGEDGSYVYMVADGVLSSGANPEGREPVEGQPNLYVRHEGTTKFIVTLTQEDGDYTPDGGGETQVGDWQKDPARRTAEVSSNGKGVVFMSKLALTGYDNTIGDVALTEVFVYETETERLACASCNPSDEAPVAPNPVYNNIGLLWGSFVPTSESGADDQYQPRVISEDGSRVFFESVEPLVPRDDNGFLDVYEWERDGTGSCGEARGCIYLLSGGQNPENSYLLDSSANGNDVFFVSRAQLVNEDLGNDNEVLYDARVGGVVAPVETSCSGTGCQGVPPAPPIFATPASVTFDGVGNYTEFASPTVVKKTSTKAIKCKKGFVKKKTKCVKSKKARKARKAVGVRKIVGARKEK
jgi:hypothetical protein